MVLIRTKLSGKIYDAVSGGISVLVFTHLSFGFSRKKHFDLI